MYLANILQAVLFGTLLSYPSLALWVGGTNICLSGVPHVPTTQNVCHWLFLTCKHVLSISQAVLFGTL